MARRAGYPPRHSQTGRRSFGYPSAVGSYRYRAFISYSHQDRAWAAWLQRALETYRVPKHLVGGEGTFGPIPARISPVFRDREDLSSAADLSATVKEALAAAESLVVVCSPAAARSAWVDSEIRHFRALGRGDRILALIVDGDPQAPDPAQQCFPPALLLGPDGSPREPLAADARKWADGKLLARLKLVAGILGMPLDALRRRDLQRRQRVWMFSLGAVTAVALAMAVLAVLAVTARNAAENRREHAEELVGYMVGDLKTKLDEVGRLDILEGVGGRVGEYLQTLDPDEVTDESLIQQAKVWRQLGEVGMDQGDLARALEAFGTSRDILGELHRRNPESAQFVFELGNAEFWVGYVHLERGEFDLAENALNDYLAWAYRLNELEPGRPEWLIEQSYAHSNLAALANRRSNANVDVALLHIEAAVALNRRVIDLAPDDPTYLGEYGETLAWLADTQILACDLGGALLSRQENVAIARQLMDGDVGNVNFRSRYAFALTGVGRVSRMVGLIEPAIESFTAARDILGQLSLMDPSNLDMRFDYLLREAYIAELLAESERMEEALQRMEAIAAALAQTLASENHSNIRHYADWIDYLLTWSDMSWRAGDRTGATARLDEALAHLQALAQSGADQGALAENLLKARFLAWQQRGADLFATPPFTEFGTVQESAGGSCASANRVRQAILSGDTEKARELTVRLLGSGYYEPGFIRTCRQYELCQGSG
ncbi:MAG: toll/interleukin-1 receptor domain-containing protein [Xanthomonadales bacterium]|nr:toll/interleukin-1 receptor domain-containing protein [Xanthomonadales bacterium]